MLKNIIFDLGNVLIEWNSDFVYDNYFSNMDDKEAFYEKTQIKKVNLELDRGLSFDEGLTALSRDFPEYHEAIWMWKHEWPKMLGSQINGSIDILNKLKERGYKLYALTNWASETFLYAEEHLEFLKSFIDIVVSGRVQLIKPDQAIYQLLLKRNNLLAEESVFIDDSKANSDAATNLGITGIHFQNAEQLHKDLQKLNIL